MASTDPTTVYHIGINDVLSLEIENVTGRPKILKVRPDGTLDFPLAGEDLIVAGRTASEAESLIARSVKLFKNPRVLLRVREYVSHIVNVWGLVDQPGELQIQRDAVPFFVIRAGVNIDDRAKIVRISRRGSSKPEEYKLADQNLGSILIFPGDTIEFGSRTLGANE